MSNRFPQPPKTKVLIKTGHCTDYNETDELAKAYKQFKEDDPGGYLLLADLDRDQARADWTYERRTAPLNDVHSYLPNVPLEHNFTTDPIGRQQLAVAQLMVDGYNRREVASMMGLTYDKVIAIVAEIRVIMAGEV